jgi:hypothetical protein
MAHKCVLAAACFHTDVVVLAKVPPALHACTRACVLAAMAARERGKTFHMREAFEAWGAGDKNKEYERIRLCFGFLVAGGLFRACDEEEIIFISTEINSKNTNAPKQRVYALELNEGGIKDAWTPVLGMCNVYTAWAEAGDQRCPTPACSAFMRVPENPKGPYDDETEVGETYSTCNKCDARLRKASLDVAREISDVSLRHAKNIECLQC